MRGKTAILARKGKIYKHRAFVGSLCSAALFYMMQKSACAYEGQNLIKMESTAYCYGTITASGAHVRPGICAGKREWIGKTAVIYDREMNLIGIYEILDTGGDGRIRNGKCLDVYLPDEQQCREYGRKTVWVQIVDAEG